MMKIMENPRFFQKGMILGGKTENPTSFGEPLITYPPPMTNLTCKGSHRCARVEKKTSAVTTRERRGAGSWPPNMALVGGWSREAGVDFSKDFL